VDVVSEAQLLADRQRVEAAEADPKKWTPEQTQKWWSINAGAPAAWDGVSFS
jgi:hypothetical protein